MLISLKEAELLVGPIRDLLVQAHLDSWDVWAKRVSDDPEFVKPLKFVRSLQQPRRNQRC